MAIEEKREARKLIRNLVLVLSFGMTGALLVALATLYLIGPAGEYTAGNILLSPEVMAKLTYNEVDPQTGSTHLYRSDAIEALYFNRETGEWHRKTVETEAYAAFYEKISDDRSLTVVPEQIEEFFRKENPSTLTLRVKKEGAAENDLESQVSFQEVQILNDGDYYRIQLRDQGGGNNWAYFYHENVFEELQKSLQSE